MKAWLTRAGFIARTRSSPEERERYERWALHVVEDAVAAPGGAASFPWAKNSPVMPLDAPDRIPRLLRDALPPPTSMAPAPSLPAPAASARGAWQALSDECLRRAPTELKPYVVQALAEGERVGGESSFLEILTRATALKQCDQPVTHPASPPVPAPAPVPAAPPLPRLKRPRPEEPTRTPSRGMPPMSAEGESNSFFAALLGAPSPTERGCADQHAAIVGTSTSLERLYSRYEPAAADIRSPPVLHRAFQHIQREAAAKEQRDGRLNALEYLNDQLKGMRQDLRVQNVASNFAVSVYELHATLALERGDIGEFNQCQSALKALYASPSVDKKQTRVADFFYYRLVYLSLSCQYDVLSTELITYTNATHCAKGERGVADFVSRRRVRSCLQLCGACEEGDISTLCRAVATFATAMSHLVRIYLPRLRVGWIETLLRATKGPVPLGFLLFHLGFVGMPTPSVDASECVWLDGSAEAAKAEFAELITRLKIDLPGHFSFDREVNVAARSRNYAMSASKHTLDAGAAYSAVQAYLSYLTARRDVTLAN